MNYSQISARCIESFGLARQIYGLKLLLTQGWSETTKWFLFNYETKKHKIPLKDGVILDFGAYKGDFTAKLLKQSKNFKIKIYEPVPKFYEICKVRFQNYGNVEVHNVAVSSDGRTITMDIDGPRTRLSGQESSVFFNSISFQEILRNLQVIELVKFNIEGMEYECLEAALKAGLLSKVDNLLIQFHNFESDSDVRYQNLTNMLQKDFEKVFGYKWLWEHWIRIAVRE
jgi:FkbM family methyltransferase